MAHLSCTWCQERVGRQVAQSALKLQALTRFYDRDLPVECNTVLATLLCMGQPSFLYFAIPSINMDLWTN